MYNSKKGGDEMLQVIKDDFDESPEDILNTINKMLNNNDNHTEETDKETKKDQN